MLARPFLCGVGRLCCGRGHATIPPFDPGTLGRAADNVPVEHAGRRVCVQLRSFTGRRCRRPTHRHRAYIWRLLECPV